MVNYSWISFLRGFPIVQNTWKIMTDKNLPCERVLALPDYELVLSCSWELSVTTIFSWHSIRYHLACTVNNLSVYFCRGHHMSKLEWQLITRTSCIPQERICNSHMIGVLVTAATVEQLRSEHTVYWQASFRGASINRCVISHQLASAGTSLLTFLSVSGEPVRKGLMSPH